MKICGRCITRKCLTSPVIGRRMKYWIGQSIKETIPNYTSMLYRLLFSLPQILLAVSTASSRITTCLTHCSPEVLKPEWLSSLDSWHTLPRPMDRKPKLAHQHMPLWLGEKGRKLLLGLGCVKSILFFVFVTLYRLKPNSSSDGKILHGSGPIEDPTHLGQVWGWFLPRGANGRE